MINFDSNITNLTSSILSVKASGSIIDQIQNDLNLPDGDDITTLLNNEEKNKSNHQSGE
jgi:hypothetical protein